MKRKTCRKCNDPKPILLFYRDKKNPDGRSNTCAECQKQAAKNRRPLLGLTR